MILYDLDLLCDLFLWGNLKSKVYIAKSRIPIILKYGIEREVRTIPCNMLESVVIANLAQRLDECVEKEGRRLTAIVFQNDLFL